MIEWYERNYPRNVRYGQYLKDIEKTPETYFGLEYTANNELIDTIAGKFAQAVYTRFYGSEIGLEELDIFDLKMRGIWNANIDLYKGFYEVRTKYIDGIEAGTVESELTAYGRIVTDETDPVKKDVETTHGESVVFTDVSQDDGSRTKEYKITHSDSGEDKRTRTKTGDPDTFMAILKTGTSDIFREFTEKFINLFNGVL